jgi:hypothetical protein
MNYTITIPDNLVPGIVATASVEGKTAEQVIGEYAVAVANKACQDLKVGPYYVGPSIPRLISDGRGNPAYTGPDAIPYVVIYPETKTVTTEVTDPETGMVTQETSSVAWEVGDQWTDPVTDVVYEYKLNEEFGGNYWGTPTPAEEVV